LANSATADDFKKETFEGKYGRISGRDEEP
jgi:hypothetical protein